MLKDKVAIITGASRGIGKATAIHFAREGARVVVTARTEQEGKIPGTIHQTAEEIRSFGGAVLPIRADISNEEEVDALIRKTLAEFDTIDVLVNNAAVGYFVDLKDTPLKHFDLLLRVNLRGTFMCIKGVLPTMMEKKSGSIINLSSKAAEMLMTPPSAGVEPRPSGTLYGATKIAIERMTKGIALELLDYNIAVNAIKPKATIASEGLLAWLPEADPNVLIPPDKFMTKAIAFLAIQRPEGGLTGDVFYDEDICESYRLG